MSKYFLQAIDHGYSTCKTKSSLSTNIFKSACTTINTQVFNNDNQITIDGKQFFFGIGNLVSDEDKISSELNMISTLATLALSGNNDYILVVNLPISQFNQKQEKFKETVLSYNGHEVIYKDKLLNYRISEALVLPQGISSVYAIDTCNKYEEKIILDIGSKTVNIALFEYNDMDNQLHVTKYLTLFKGILNLYEQIINQVNIKYDMSLEYERARYILQHGLMVDGKQQDMGFIHDIIREYLMDIIASFKKEFACWRSVRLFVTGGGAEILFPVFQNNFPTAMKINNPVMSNVLGLYNKGKYDYAKYL